ncbi:MAG: hypothetical protein IKK79_05550 [Spirochaetaceae bacterium]|nr:hypothetical protein [Spirochaetaceae bacterium]
MQRTSTSSCFRIALPALVRCFGLAMVFGRAPATSLQLTAAQVHSTMKA